MNKKIQGHTVNRGQATKNVDIWGWVSFSAGSSCAWGEGFSSIPGLDSLDARSAHQMSQPKMSSAMARHALEWGHIKSGQEALGETLQCLC